MVVGVTSQGSNRRGQQRSGSGRVGNENRNRNAGNKIQGPMEKNTHQGTDCRSGHPLNTPAISLRCLADCRVESLIAESTRRPALVLQPTRQVSPTIIGKSIPD
ncbi:unnamed protein product, partial [Staurois parvus]